MLTKKQFKKSLNKKNKKVNSTKKNKKEYRKKTRLNKLKNSYNGGANGELKNTTQEISHYWFKQWDDHGVPDFTVDNVKTNFDTFITTLYKDIKDNENNKDNTTVIHCSDGGGRSGVVYVILSILFNINFVDKNIVLESETVLVKEIIKTIISGIQHRVSLVETEDQCKFIFTYLLTKITFTNTVVTLDNTLEKIEDKLVEEFKKINPNPKPQNLVTEQECSSDTKAFDDRNKNENILPYLNSKLRVRLDTTELHDSCDYINASRMIDFSNTNNKVIITQCPTEYTLPHFYLMLHQQKVKRIVMVTNLVEKKINKICDPYITDESKENFMYDMGQNKNEFKSTLVLTPTNNTFTLMDTTAQAAKAAQEKAAQVLQEAQEKERLEKKAKLEKEAAQAALEKEASQSAQEKKRVEQEAKDLKEKEAKELQAKELQEAQEKAAAQAAQAALEKADAQEEQEAQPQPKTSICELLRLYKPKSKQKIKVSSI